MNRFSATLARRLAWLPSHVILTAFVGFWLLALAFPPTPNPRRGALPLFVNAAPVSAKRRTQALSRALDVHASSESRHHVLILGGAGLPTWLPKLAAMPTRQRTRLIRALAPVAARMGFSAEGGGPPKLLDWLRFWEEREGDFRRQAISRSVRRYLRHPSRRRRQEVYLLDTAALPALMRELGRSGPLPSERRIELIVPLIERAWGKTPGANALPTPVEKAVALRSRWLDEQDFYEWPTAQGRATGVVAQTAFFRSLSRLFTAQVDLTAPYSSKFGLLARAGLRSVVLLSLGVMAAHLLALAVASFSHGRLGSARPWAVGIALWPAALPSLAWVSIWAVVIPWKTALPALLAVTAMLFPSLYRGAREVMRRRFHWGIFQAQWAQGRSIVSALSAGGRQYALVHLLGLGTLELPEASVAVFVAEKFGNHEGMGFLLRRALAEHDVPMLTGLCMAGSLVAAGGILGGELLQARALPLLSQKQESL